MFASANTAWARVFECFFREFYQESNNPGLRSEFLAYMYVWKRLRTARKRTSGSRARPSTKHISHIHERRRFEREKIETFRWEFYEKLSNLDASTFFTTHFRKSSGMTRTWTSSLCARPSRCAQVDNRERRRREQNFYSFLWQVHQRLSKV